MENRNLLMLHANATQGERLTNYILRKCLPEGLCARFQKSERLPIASVRYDFFINTGGSIYIEYNGQQHYMAVELYEGEEGFRRRQELDQAKRDYVKSIGGHLLEIPYWLSNEEVKEAIIDFLIPLIPVTDFELDPQELSDALSKPLSPYTLKEVADYFGQFSARETAEYFDISEYTAYRCYKAIYGEAKTVLNRMTDDEIAEYYLTHTLVETTTKCKRDPAIVNRAFKKKFKMSKPDYYRENHREEIAEYFLTHKEEEVTAKFDISMWIVKKCMKEVYGMSKRAYLREINKDSKPKKSPKFRLFKALSPDGETYEDKNQTQFAKKHALERSAISMCLSGMRTEHKGWKFEYID